MGPRKMSGRKRFLERGVGAWEVALGARVGLVVLSAAHRRLPSRALPPPAPAQLSPRRRRPVQPSHGVRVASCVRVMETSRGRPTRLSPATST